MGQLGKGLLTATGNYGQLGKEEKIILLYNVPTIFRTYKKDL